MASKEVMLAFLRSSRWRTPALALMAALILPVCYAAQDSAAEDSLATRDISAEQTLNQVRTLHAAGRFAAALEPLETYLAADSRNTVVRLEYARTLAILRRFPEAAREYRRVLETEPQNAAALIGVAKVASWQGQNQLALETYDRVLARRPSLYDALVGKGFVLLWMGRQEEARALFREAQRQYPNDPEVREALAALGATSSSSIRTSAAGETLQPAASDAKRPAASALPLSAPAETSRPAPAETLKAAPTEVPQLAPSDPPKLVPAEVLKRATQSLATTPPPSSFPEGASAVPALTVKEPQSTAWAVGPMSRSIALNPQKSAGALHGKGKRERAAAAPAVIAKKSKAPPAPNGSPSPMRVSVATAVQLAMLGMVAVVAGAIAYRTYRVRLSSAPLLARRVFELPPSSLVPPPRSAAAMRAGKEGPLAGRVLVVHPQEAVRDFARKVLAGAGAEVLALGRGEDAVVRLEKSPYDAIVVSDQLPAGWSGREIYRWLERNQPGAERKFVLALTDETDPEMQSFLEESRALAISAPFGVSDLLAMTRLAMGRSRAQA